MKSIVDLWLHLKIYLLILTDVKPIRKNVFNSCKYEKSQF